MIPRVRLRAASVLGARPRVMGKAIVKCRGRLEIGDDFLLVSRPLLSHVVVELGGHLVIGDRVTIGPGAAIACTSEIDLGDDVRLGRSVMVLDTDYHEVASMKTHGASSRVQLHERVVVEDDVVVLKGANIGAGARIGARSVVSGVIPAGAYASGVPARVRRPAGAGRDVQSIVESVLHDEASLDSLASLRLLVACEEELGLHLPEETLRGATSVESVVHAIEAHLAK